MPRILVPIVLCHAFAVACAQQQHRPVFVPPAAHDMARYESSLALNPFILPTVPPPAVAPPLLTDWTLGSVYGDIARPTVAVVNMKTGQRVRLRSDGVVSAGMRLLEVKFGQTRKDILALVEYAGGRTELRFNTDWLRQTAAAKKPQSGPRHRSGENALAAGTPFAPGAAPSRAMTVARAPSITPSGGASGVIGMTPAGGPLLLAAAGESPVPGADLPASPDAPDATATPDAPSTGSVWVPLASATPLPLRRHLLRPSVLPSHPDPQ